MYKLETVCGYKVNIWWSNEDKCYIAEVPDLPGCMADGKTLEELYQEVKEHIEIWLEVNSGRDFPIPKPAE